MPLTAWQIEATAKLDGVRLALSHQVLRQNIKAAARPVLSRLNVRQIAVRCARIRMYNNMVYKEWVQCQQSKAMRGSISDYPWS